MYSISVWFAKFYFLFTQPWAATLRSSSPVGASWCIHSAAGGWCTLLSVLMLVCMGISWWTHSTPKIQNQNKWRIFLKKRKAIWIYIIFEKLERPEISNVLEELCLQFAEYIFGKIFERLFRFNYNNFLVENIWDSLFNSEEISGLVDKEISIEICKNFRFLCFFVNAINNFYAR